MVRIGPKSTKCRPCPKVHSCINSYSAAVPLSGNEVTILLLVLGWSLLTYGQQQLVMEN